MALTGSAEKPREEGTHPEEPVPTTEAELPSTQPSSSAPSSPASYCAALDQQPPQQDVRYLHRLLDEVLECDEESFGQDSADDSLIPIKSGAVPCKARTRHHLCSCRPVRACPLLQPHLCCGLCGMALLEDASKMNGPPILAEHELHSCCMLLSSSDEATWQSIAPQNTCCMTLQPSSGHALPLTSG